MAGSIWHDIFLVNDIKVYLRNNKDISTDIQPCPEHGNFVITNGKVGQDDEYQTSFFAGMINSYTSPLIVMIRSPKT